MYSLEYYLTRQREFSVRTFGPVERPAGLIDHIRKELVEIEQDPRDLKEWIDVVTLAFDGALGAGYTEWQICEQLEATLRRNIARKWPDWRTMDPNKAIEHDRTEETK
jgi:hypothetical protein